MKIYCCECSADIEARLTDGAEIYPHRQDLHALPFWRCDACKNYVGCHHKTRKPTKPLGVIAGKEMKNARQHIHRLIDPMWQGSRSKTKRQIIYNKLGDALGREYHTAELRTIEEARLIYKAALGIKKEMQL